jgi:putative ABC transport system permease protein
MFGRSDVVLPDPDWGTALLFFYLVLIILGVVAVMAARRPVLFKMGLRNAARRPSQTTLVLVGLMIGTAILSGALVSGDTMEFAIVKDVYYTTDLIDEIVGVSGGLTFNGSVLDDISSDPDVRRLTDGVSPALAINGITVIDRASGQTEPSTILHGIDPTVDRAFGRFKTTDGKRIDGSDLGMNETLINKRLADALLAKVGHDIEIYYLPLIPAMGPEQQGPGADNSSTQPTIQVRILKVKHIVENEGKANYNGARMIFMGLSPAQAMLGMPGQINMVKVSNKGGIVDGAKDTDKVTKAIQDVIDGLGPDAGADPQQFDIGAFKMDAVDIAESSSASFSDFLVMASSFTIAAGVMLIVNIFVMLAEERKRELGISRAVGMRRTALVKEFMFEGVVYSLIASIIGAFVGILIAYALIQGVFSAVGAGGLDVPFYFKNSSLLLGFSWGFMITIGTVALASWRVSKLNIVRAIRSIEEPVTVKGVRRNMVIGGVLLGMGLFFTLAGYTGGEGSSGIPRILGPNMAFFGAAMVARRWIRPEGAYTFAGLMVLMYSLWFLLKGTVTEDEAMFALVILGLLMVFGAVLALVSNSRAMVRGFGRLFSFSPRSKAVVEPAVGHPLNKPFRTGMTIAMFSLVIFIVLLFSIFFTVFTPDLSKESGGYDLLGTTSVPVADIYDIDIGGMPGTTTSIDYTTLNTKVESVDSVAQLYFWGNFYVNRTEIPTYGPPAHSLFGIDLNFSRHVTYTLAERANGYQSDSDAWMAVANDPDLAIVDSTTSGTHIPIKVGDRVSLPQTIGGNTSKTYKVIGIADVLLFPGLFVQKDGLLKDFKQVRGNNMFLIKVRSGENIEKVAKQLEADLSIIGMNVIVLEEMLKDLSKSMESIFQLFELFMSLGLVVGVAALGVLSVRTVIERKQEIGIMRAIGYRRSMVLKAFLFEMLFVTLLGVCLGLIIGYLAGYGIWKTGMEGLGVEFTVPWHRIGMIVLMTFIAAVVCTIVPAYKASRTNPAEAVRWVE